jgi:hypothetical protein
MRAARRHAPPKLASNRGHLDQERRVLAAAAGHPNSQGQRDEPVLLGSSSRLTPMALGKGTLGWS